MNPLSQERSGDLELAFGWAFALKVDRVRQPRRSAAGAPALSSRGRGLVGCIAAGAARLWLARRGLGVHRARLAVVSVCAARSAVACLAINLSRGPAMDVALLVVGAGAMGLFPCSSSLAQEMAPGRIGRATGTGADSGLTRRRLRRGSRGRPAAARRP